MLSTRHGVDFAYTPPELQALFRDAREQQALGRVKHGDVPRGDL